MISPSLFIGIGSTGLDMLQQLQQHVFEHYGRAALDAFRYIAIETREGAELIRTEWGDNRITLLKPVLTNTDSIRRAMDQKTKTYLDDWLDRKVLTIQGSDFIDGASNIRMAGRLILWENWLEVSEVLRDALNDITGDDKRRSTYEFLVEHYKKHHQTFDETDSLLRDKPNIYIMGTLCGGTCSGMFIDIAYYMKQIAGLWATNLEDPCIPKIIGVFTTFDHATLMGAHGEGARRNAANTWAALTEYDYLCHNETRYQTIFPDGTTVDTNERPVDVLYLLSCTASAPHQDAQSNLRSSGRAHFGSLNHMAASLVFTETVGGLLTVKQAIRTDHRGKPRASTANAKHHSPCIYTCGLATFWFPRYRVALGAASNYGAAISGDLLVAVTSDSKDPLNKKIDKGWRGLLDAARAALMSHTPGTLDGYIRTKFDESRGKDLERNSGGLRDVLSRRIHDELDMNGNCDTEIKNRKAETGHNLVAGIRDFIARVINEERSVACALFCLEKLNETMEDLCSNLPRDYPNPDTGRVRPVDRETAAALVLASSDVMRQRKLDLLEDVSDYMCRQVGHIASYHLRSVLEDAMRHMGVSSSLSEERRKAGKLTEHERLRRIKKLLEACKESLGEEYKSLCGKLFEPLQVSLVTQHESVKADIDSLAARFKTATPEQKEKDLETICQGRPLSEFLGYWCDSKGNEQDRMENAMRSHLVREGLERLRSFSVVEKVGRLTPARISDFAKHGLPHLELAGGQSGLASVVIGRPVSFVAGESRHGLNELLNSKLSGTQCESLFESERSPVIVPELSHMVVFYREEPLLYMDENLATAHEFESCYEGLEDPDKRISVHTHQKGRSEFDPSIYHRRNLLVAELMPLARKILSYRTPDGQLTSDVFGVEGAGLVYRTTLRDGTQFVFTADDAGIDNCARDEKGFELFRRGVEEKVRELGWRRFTKRLVQYLSEYESGLQAGGTPVAEAVMAEQKSILKIPLVQELKGSRASADDEGDEQ